MSKTVKIRPEYGNLRYFNKNTGKEDSKFDIISRDFRYILRAVDPKKLSAISKPLSRVARVLLTNYYDMIKNSPNGIIFKNHEDIYNLTEVGISQNKRAHNELRDLFNIQYHKSIKINERKYYFGFAIEFTENTENILKNPKLFYSSKSNENEPLEVQKRTPRCSKKNASLYKEEENPLENLKSRSIETEEKIPTPVNEETRSNFERNILKEEKKVLTLKDYYPLSKDDCYRLQKISKRSFTQNAMNEILLDMSRTVPAVFYSKKGFFSYFGICLALEKRDAFKTASETFRIKTNLTEEDHENRRIFKYLEKVEYSIEVSPEQHFRKKIAGGTLLPKKAFYFLKAYSSIEIQADIAKIHLTKEVELSESDLKILLAQVKASHETIGNLPITKIRLITAKSTKQVKEMPSINQQILDSFGSVRGQEILKICNISERPDKAIQVEVTAGEEIPENDKSLLRQCIKTIYGEEAEIRTKPKAQTSTNMIHFDKRNDTNWSLWETRADLWEKFKKGILEQLRKSEGEHIFNAWFDKLKHSQDQDAKQLTLTGSEFFITYISQNYSGLIENTAKNKKINITLVYEGKEERGYRPIVFTPTEGRKF